MKYSVETIVRFVIGLVLALVFICGTTLKSDLPLWVDLFMRFCGAACMFLLGFGWGFDVGCKDGADNDG